MVVSPHQYSEMPDVAPGFEVLSDGVVVRKDFLTQGQLNANDLHHVLIGVDGKLADLSRSM